ncbi:GntR family transcriptional regulator [Nesterenkonia massiliensis]|uniref:GntR family transcriptional regulator n=1 Tax=Nesterenkonia massiliensis TaxID=1232429 RepID=UPI000405B74E|nr:GntR family transcriptional regulator [Nesterenkonia massiliensis]
MLQPPADETPGGAPDPGSAAEVLAARLRRLISQQRLRPGERIGSERGLAEQLEVPRSLLRQALQHLESEHLVRRSLGRTGGVFADDGKIQRHLNTVQGVPDMVRQQGYSVQTRVIRAVLSTPFPEEQRALQLQEDSAVYRIVRLRLAGGVTWSLDTSVLPARRYPGLLSQDLTGSLYLLLTSRYGLSVDRAEETVEATSSDTEQSRTLGIPEGSGLLEVHRVTFDPDDAPAEYAHDFFRADRTRIHTQKVGTNWMRTRRG